MSTIAVNTRLLLKNRLDGIGWFSYEVLRRITTAHPEHKFIFFFDRPFSPEFVFAPNITPVVAGPPARHPVLIVFWLEVILPRLLKKYKADLFFSPVGSLSLSADVRQVAVLHDLNFEANPKDIPFTYSAFYRFFYPRYAKKAVRLATVSEFSKNDIVNRYGISKENIDVVYNGANENYKPISETGAIATRNNITGGQPYFLFVGSLHPRKNVATLFRAFEIFRKKTQTNIKLVIVGNKMWWTKEMEDVYNLMLFQDDVIFTGRLEPEQLCSVTASAIAMVYPSTYEGFGIPVLEAMQCDVPVITSNITSMPEVAGNAALLVDPYSIDDISNAMIKITSDLQLRFKLIENGRLQRRKFSWNASANKMWSCIEKIIP